MARSEFNPIESKHSTSSNLWNLPVNIFTSRYEVLTGIMTQHFGYRPIDILEIGVFRAGLVQNVFAARLNVASYEGVDPYAGDPDDPYLGSYWQNSAEAEPFYSSAQAIFDRYPQAILHRKNSQTFFRALPPGKKYDVIFVDGDHRYDRALWDMGTWFYRVKDGGLMIADDYANVDTPHVTKAINKFIQQHRANIKRMGYRTLEFQNAGKEVPIVLTFVYFEPVMDRDKQNQAIKSEVQPEKQIVAPIITSPNPNEIEYFEKPENDGELTQPLAQTQSSSRRRFEYFRKIYHWTIPLKARLFLRDIRIGLIGR